MEGEGAVQVVEREGGHGAPSVGRYLMDCGGSAVGNYGTRSLTPHPILASSVPFALYPL